MKRVILTSFIVGLILIIGTIIAGLYAKGYRILPTQDGKSIVKGTGLLVATSYPDAAKVFVNDQFLTATDDTINLGPGEYEVKITKDGYFPWKKKIVIKEEVVSRADAMLLPIAPKLESLTTTGVNNPVIDSTGTTIAYIISSSTLEINGIYILNLGRRPILGIGGSSTQLANTVSYDFTNARLEFSPESDQLVASVSGRLSTSAYLLSARNFNSNPQNITYNLEPTRSRWNNLKEEKLAKQIADQKKELATFIKSNFIYPVFSPERDKILYEASTSATIPIIIKPRLIGSNPTVEIREIKQGNIYVYDIKEDRNYMVLDVSGQKEEEQPTKFIWYGDARHLIYTKDKKIHIMEYDGQNVTTVYAGPFDENFVYPFDGESLVMLTNLGNEDTPYNLYRLVLK